MAAKVKKNDRVVVLTGRDRGKIGRVLKVIPKEDRVVVEGVNIIKRHTKPSMASPNGGIVQREAAIHVSNVAIADPKTDKPTRVGFKIVDGAKIRVAKKSGEKIDV